MVTKDVTVSYYPVEWNFHRKFHGNLRKKMNSSFHSISRKKISLCGRKAFRELNLREQVNINALREEKLDFQKESTPIGVCKKCALPLKLKKAFKIGLWDAHAKAGMIYRLETFGQEVFFSVREGGKTT